MEYNIYCDESCHLEHDKSNAMTLGAIWCPKERRLEICQRIKEIKKRNNFNLTSEAKWTKICPKHEKLYWDLITLFFDIEDLKFRCLLIPDKSCLNHHEYAQTHDDWYYKMYFTMLKYIFDRDNSFNVYIDIKDTHSDEKLQKLKEVCCNSIYDFSESIIKNIQPIRSQEVEIMQLVDILIGAIAYENRIFPIGFEKSETKINMINLIKARTLYTLHKSSLLREEKFNLFVWDADYRRYGI